MDCRWLRAGLCLVAIMSFATVRLWAEPEPYRHTETWSEPGLGGWTGETAHASLANLADSLSVDLPAQDSPAFAWDVARYSLEPGIRPSSISWRFLAADVAPSEVRLCLHSADSGRTWYSPVTGMPVNVWTDVEIDVDRAKALWLAGPNATDSQFTEDLDYLDWAGVYILRNWSTDSQAYQIDNFSLHGVGLDTDGDGIPDFWESRFDLKADDETDGTGDKDADGMSNYAEFRAGSNPTNRLSTFTVDSGRDEDPGHGAGIVLRWSSISNRTYRVLRADTPGASFLPLESGLAATPPRNTYHDGTATNRGPYFFRVEVE